MASTRSSAIFEKARHPLKRNKVGSREEFRVLARQWYLETRTLSDTEERFSHPNYQAIIALGKASLPFIIEELYLHGGSWFGALEAITGEEPYLPEDYGSAGRLRKRWVQWGFKRGYLHRYHILKRIFTPKII